jgi:Tol biopolymer transport system component
MLSGRPLFRGETVGDTLAEVLKAEIPWSALPKSVPSHIITLLRRCLDRDRKTRLRDIGEARIAIFAPVTTIPAPQQADRKRAASKLPVAVLAGIALLSTGLYVRGILRRPPPPEEVRFEIYPPEGARLSFTLSAPRISPDGRLIVARLSRAGVAQLWIRSLRSGDWRALDGTENPVSMIWTLDSRSIVFASNGKLKRVEPAGGLPQAIAEAGTGAGAGIACGLGGVILFGGSNGTLMRVQAGGVPTPITKLDPSRGEVSHSGPFFLPDGKRFLYRVTSTKAEHSGIYVGSLDGGTLKRLDQASQTRTFGGYVFFPRDQAALAQKLHVDRVEFAGEPFVVSDSGAFPSLSDTGVLIFQSRAAPLGSQVIVLDRSGKRTAAFPFAELRSSVGHVELSPDGRSVVSDGQAQVGPPRQDLWTMDLGRGVPSRLTFDANTGPPAWSPDGRFLYYSRDEKIFRIPSSGTQEPVVVAPGSAHHIQISPDGAYAIFDAGSPENSVVMTVPLNPDAKPVAVQRQGSDPRFSYDGKWIAYSRPVGGQRVIFVESWPLGKAKYAVPQPGGQNPRWRGDGRELFFIGRDRRIMSVDVTERGGALEFGIPKPVFKEEVRPEYRFDVSRDGQRFVYAAPLRSDVTGAISVVLNWRGDASGQ